MPLPLNPNLRPESNEEGKSSQNSGLSQPSRLPSKRPVPSDGSIPLVTDSPNSAESALNRPKNLDGTTGAGSYAAGRRRDFGSESQLGGEAARYTMLSNISVDEVLNAPYETTFKRLEPKVLEVKTWLQDYITEVKLIEQVGKARASRGDDLMEMKKILDQILLKYFTNNPWGNQQDVSKITSLVLNEILGFGPLEPLWMDKTITEIMVNGPEKIYIEKEGKLRRAYGIQFRDTAHLLELCQQLLGQIGKTLDVAHSAEDGRLSDGSRINATHPVIGPAGPFLTIRRFPEKIFTLRTLIETGSFTEEMAEEIGNLIYHKASTIVSGGTGSGKALDDNTLLPTPHGFVKMGDIKVGDYVLSEQGLPTKVTGKFAEKEKFEAYTVTFSDGNVIVADADHNWFTYDRKARTSLSRYLAQATAKFNSHTRNEFKTVLPQVRTTKEIAETLHTDSGHLNHSILVSGVAHFDVNEANKRIIDPYLFGQWLGSGQKDKATLHAIGEETIQAFADAYGIDHTGGSEYSVGGDFSDKLETLNVLDNKHIPTAYLFAPEEDRRALLAGLTDSLGSVNRKGEIEILSNADEIFVDQVRTLIQSLGYIVHKDTKTPTFVDHGELKKGETVYSLMFVSTQPVFRVANKAEKHKLHFLNPLYGKKSDMRYIVSVERLDKEIPMHCITVDADSHLYLASEGFITTHNTSMLNALSGCIPNDERIITIEDSLELRLHPEKHFVSMEARRGQQGEENTLGNVSIRDLVKNALRQRPDRIIVGEVRDGTAYDMLQAFNTGHEGSMSTIHSNNPRAAVERLSNLIAQVGELSSDQALTLISSGVDLLIQVARYEDGSRRVSEIVEIPSRVEVHEGKVHLEPTVLWEFQQTGIDSNNKIVGHYVKINDLSEDFVKVHRLDKKRRLPLEELLALSDTPETASKK